MPLLNYTTAISAQKTVGEIMAILVSHGAKAVLMNYDETGQIESLSFQVATVAGEMGIRLPINPDAVLKVMSRQHIPKKYQNKTQAIKVAWRIAETWIRAQSAIIETEMVSLEQIFLPYWITPSGKTLYDHLVDTKFQLGRGKEEQ